MEENEYRDTYKSINPTRCVFEKSINSRRCQCALAQRFNLADREGVRCTVDLAQQRCVALLKVMRGKALFAMRLTKIEGLLPHGKEVKVQTGGLLGLQKLLNPTLAEKPNVDDIQSVLNDAIDAYGSIEQLPFDQLMPDIVRFEGRNRKVGSPSNKP